MLSVDSQLSSPSTPFKYEFLYIDSVHLCLRSPSSRRFTKGHPKLPFAVFVVRFANPFSHEAFSAFGFSLFL
ncbi:hypothetical protein A2U01_0066749 [Trifolium medium]|uniref:Uncharacterized protein n=1 Tax=Trifolium medium TaxID=97028 RepID=A0A392SC41_9FABA|nr:hypothetical protein [Trifolium medium]